MVIPKHFIIISLISNILASSINHSLFELIGTKPDKEQFKMWHLITDRPYDINSEEAINRYKIFKSNLKLIKSENEKNLSYKLGLGPFTDLTADEFMSRFTTLETTKNEKKTISNREFKATPNKMIDWSYLYPKVKNQGQCGSCGIFAAIGAIEGLLAIIESKYTALSEQMIIDCNNEFYCVGEHSGMRVTRVFDFIKKHKGMALEADYPTTGRGYTGICKKDIKLKYKLFYCEECEDETCYEDYIINLVNNGPYASHIQVNSS